MPVLEAELARKPAPDATADARDQLAQRQARAAVALLRLEQGEKVVELVRHSPDPSVRSYIVNWLKPLGAGPKALDDQAGGPRSRSGFDPEGRGTPHGCDPLPPRDLGCSGLDPGPGVDTAPTSSRPRSVTR